MGPTSQEQRKNEQMLQVQVTVPPGISEVRVLKTEINQLGALIITIESTKKRTSCHWCGRWFTKPHGYNDWVMRHMQVFGRLTYLRYGPKRYQYPDYKKGATITQRLLWRQSNSPHTLVSDNRILLHSINSTSEIEVKGG